MNDNDILLTAKEAAYEAGKYLRESFEKRPEIEFKGDVNLVTQKDVESQRIIYSIIKNKFPNHSILKQENLNIEKDENSLWLIDPIDGTTNIAHSIPFFSVSIAFRMEGVIRVGVVYIPMLDEMYHAIRGEGAYLNNKRIWVSKEANMVRCLLATGFPYDRRHSSDNNVKNFNTFILKCQDIRRMGSAAIDLCFTAAGRFDGFWEPKLYPWDTAAAFLMVLEAGGQVTDFSGNAFDPFMKECLASNGIIHEQMLEVLKGSLGQD